MSAEHVGPVLGAGRRTIDDLVAAHGVAPVQDVADLAVPGLFDDEAEYQEFLAFVRSMRGTGEG